MSTKKTSEEKAQDVGSVINKNKSSSTQRERDSRAARATEVKTASANLSVEKAVQSVAAVGLTIQKSLSSVGEELLARTAELDQVKEAIQVYKDELEELHDKDILASSIEVLIARHEEKKTSLEKVIADAQANWQRLQAETLEARKRENEQYNYDLQQKRKAADDEYSETVRKRTISDGEQEANKIKNWNEREERLAKAEQEIITKAQAVAIEVEKVKKEMAQDKAIAIATINKDNAHALALVKKDSETDSAIKDGQIKTLTQDNHRLLNAVAELQAKLSEAQSKVAEIAKDAISGASTKLALDTALSIKNDQGNGGPRKS